MEPAASPVQLQLKCPVSAEGSGEPLQPSVTVGGSGKLLQLTAASTPPSVLAGNSGESAQLSTVSEQSTVYAGGSEESVQPSAATTA